MQINILVIALISALIGAYLFFAITKFLLRLKLKKRFQRASIGEGTAQTLLEEMGYTIEETQKTSLLSMWINDEEFSYIVRPDAFAIKDNERYLVEVKTGKVATNPKHTATRRQLLEYFHGFDVDGVLLIDAELQKIHRVHFESRLFNQETPRLVKEVNVKALEPTSKKPIVIAFVLGFLVATGWFFYGTKTRL